MLARKILITGAGGMLARAVYDVMRGGDLEVVALGHDDLDVTNAAAVRGSLHAHKPDVVFQGAAYTSVDQAETEEQRAFEVNAHAAAHAAAVCNELGARFVYPSTDYVFDGAARIPYAPDAPVHPINVYGRSKAAGEAAARQARDFIVVRTSWLFGAYGANFVRTVANRMKNAQPMRVVTDQIGAPTWTVDAAHAIHSLLSVSAQPGIYHFANSGTGSWYDLAQEVAGLLGSKAAIEPCLTADYPTAARRPRYSVLDCSSTEAIVGRARDWRTALHEAVTLGAY